jgi:peptide-methionine (S)-S-oxide reductase
MNDRHETAIFGAGCFWGVEEAFRRIEGVADATVGYAGGHTANPSYQEVCTGRTGHAEVVRVGFDPARVSYQDLLEAFWNLHDPTQVNRQGPDVGSQYRSLILVNSPEQEAATRESIAALEASGQLPRPIATEIAEAGPFWTAEEDHQRYLEKRGIWSCHTR